MITLIKLYEYERFHGFYDGFYIQKVKQGTQESSDEEWFLISNLIQDIHLINNGLASRDFSENLEKKLSENCENENTISFLKELANKKW